MKHFYEQDDVLYLARPIHRPPTAPHSHSFFEISYVKKGYRENIINGKLFPFQRGSCCILRPQDTHYFREKKNDSNSYEHIDIYVSQEKFEWLCNTLSPSLFTNLLKRTTPLMFYISNELISTMNNRINLLIAQKHAKELLDTFHSSLIVEILTMYLEYIEINESIYPSWLQKMLLELNSIEFMSMNINQLAKHYGYSTDHLSKEFRKYIGIKLSDYITQARISYSIPLLNEGTMKIIDIAFLLGYQKQSTFSSNFKAIMHCTPKEYQKQKRKLEK